MSTSGPASIIVEGVDLYESYRRQGFLLPSTVVEALGVDEPPRRLVLSIPGPHAAICEPLPSQPSAPSREIVLACERVWSPSLLAEMHVYVAAEVHVRLSAEAQTFTDCQARAWLRAQTARLS